MKKLTTRFLVSDLDDTLLSSDKKLADLNKKSIEQFRRAGGLFTIATGRSLPEAKQFIEELELTLPAILGNGSIIYDPVTEELTVVDQLPETVVAPFFSKIGSRPKKTDILVTTAHQIYTSDLQIIDPDEFAKRYSKLEILPELSKKTIPHPIMKIILVTEPSNMNQVLEWTKSLDLPVDQIQSADFFLELMPKNISKATALMKLLDRFQISLEETAAVGDHLNDIAMLSKVGKPFAVANAHPTTLHTAQQILPSNNESAIHHLIQQYLLKDLEVAK